MLKDITKKTFEAIKGEAIDVSVGDKQFRAIVDSVNLYKNDSGQPRQPFSVELLAENNDHHEQQIFVLRHPDLGEVSVFMVPLGLSGDRMRYEIVFN